MTPEVLYEDRGITVCRKPAGVSSEDAGPDSMPALLRTRWGMPDAYVGVVHRLDLPTEGVMVYARTPRAAADLSRQIAGRQMQKEYLCVCSGLPDPPEGSMEDFLFKDRSGKVFPVKSLRKGAKQASLSYSVLDTRENAALCRVRLDTGRTHQIRVQFASRKHPLHGDGKYGSRVKGPLALFCCALTLTVPGRKQPETFSLPMPETGAFAVFQESCG